MPHPLVIHVFLHRQLEVELPASTRKNGTLYLHVVLANDNGRFEWQHLQREGMTVLQRIALTQYMEPRAATFNLLGGNDVSIVLPAKGEVLDNYYCFFFSFFGIADGCQRCQIVEKVTKCEKGQPLEAESLCDHLGRRYFNVECRNSTRIWTFAEVSR